MSGHSKWHKIKHQKAATDKKKSQIFGRLTREILIAARGETDPAKNAALRDAITRAKKANMPQANIDRLLDRRKGATIQEVIYEGFGPGGTALLVFAATDNPNRTVAEMRSLFKNNGGNLGTPGSAVWKFAEKFVVSFEVPLPNKKDELEMALIEAGAEDIRTRENTATVFSAPINRQTILTVLMQFGITPTDTNLEHVASQPIQPSEENREKLQQLVEKLEEHDDVLQAYTDALI